MKLHTTPINGADYNGDQASPEAALQQFYAAFNQRDLALMRTNWALDPDIVLCNPLGGVRRGWDEIEPLYARLFTGAAQVQVEFYDYTLHLGAELCYAVGRERGAFRLGTLELPLAIRTSRVFRNYAGAWRQVHHHGSLEDPELLARYQAAVIANR